MIAEEVRSLAGKKCRASRDTVGLIENANAAVSKGRQIAVSTAGALDQGVTASSQAMDLVRGISAASAQQAEHIRLLQGRHEPDCRNCSVNSATARRRKRRPARRSPMRREDWTVSWRLSGSDREPGRNKRKEAEPWK